MLHKKLLLGLLLALSILSFGLIAQAQESTEEAPSALALPVLEDGVTVEGVISEDAETLLYVFNANEGDVVTISMNQITEDLDPFLVLLGPAGEFIANDDDSGELEFSALLEEIELPTTGTYFIMASTYGSLRTLFQFEAEEELAFELTISGITPIEGLEADFQFTAGGLVAGEAVAAEISFEQASWYFIFEGNAGDVVTVAAESEAFDTILHVFGPGGGRVAVNDDIDLENGNFNSAVDSLELPEDGVYLVIISNPSIFFFGIDEDDDSVFGEFSISLEAGE